MKKLTALLVLVCFTTAIMPMNVLALSCGRDLNNDGFTDSDNEVATCVSYPVHGGQGDSDYCSVEATNCVRPEPTAPIKICLDAGYTYIATTDRCEKAPECPTGTWNATMGKCDIPPICKATETTTVSSSNGYIYRPQACETTPGGQCLVMRVIDAASGMTTALDYAVFDANCTWTTMHVVPSGTADYVWNMFGLLPLLTGQQKTQFGTTIYNNSANQTQNDPDCGSGSYDAAESLCTAAFTLSHDCVIGTYNPTTGMCESDTFNCPLGSYSCFDTGGTTPQCSPNPCVDLADLQHDEILPPPDDSWIRDDGEIDSSGQCVGKIYVFSGKSARCRPPGLQVGMINNCCDSDGTISDSKTGNKYMSYVNALKTTYQMAKTAYYSYQIGTGAMTATTAASGAVTVTSTATGATVTTMSAGTEMAAGVSAASSSAGAGGAAGVGAGMQGFTTALFNPATIAIAIVVMVVMKVLMGSGCDENDVQAAMFNESGYCHYLGDLCVKKNSIMGCIQRAKRFCCFNSKMGRIVAEQGRPQLKSFGLDGDWGTPQHPNCRGFLPEEFQQLDFSKIDLSEYYGDMMEDMENNVHDAQQRIQQGITDHYQQTQ